MTESRKVLNHTRLLMNAARQRMAVQVADQRAQVARRDLTALYANSAADSWEVSHE